MRGKRTPIRASGAAIRRRPELATLNGTIRPVGMWRLAGFGPLEWMISHRPFIRMLVPEADMPSIYTPKIYKPRRKRVPGLDSVWRRGPIESWPKYEDPF